MSDNEDLLGDDLGDHSLTDYNLGNEEEEQLLADDYDMASQNVPTSVGPYRDTVDMGPTEYPAHSVGYNQPMQYHMVHASSVVETECIVPNISVEVPNPPLPDHSTYAPYKPPVYEPELAVVPAAIPAAPIESPQIVPSEIVEPITNGDRERFVSERPPGAQRTPQVRNIPDSLDKVYVPRAAFGGRGRNTWRPHAHANTHPYRRNNMHRVNFAPRPVFPPPQVRVPQSQPPLAPEVYPEIRPEPVPTEIIPDHPVQMMRQDIHNIRPEIRPEIYPEIRQEIRPDIRPEIHEIRHDMHPMRPVRQGIRPDLPPGVLPELPPQVPPERPIPDIFRIDNRPTFQRFPFRSNIEERPFPPRPVMFQPAFPRFAPPDTHNQLREQEVRMLPVLPPILPGKKVLINPHFKGNFQPPVEGLPTYIPTRIHKSPPPSPTLDIKFGPVKDIDEAAERFIAEQRNALARAATRKFARREPQRYIENTTIEIENELARRGDRSERGDRSSEDELLRRQEEFINANRAGLRRRMRSPTPPRRSRSPSPSPRRSPERPERRAERPERAERRAPPSDEDSEYRRRLREQESLRERVLRAKEVRRRKNAVLLQQQIQERERDRERESQPPRTEESKPAPVKELVKEPVKEDSKPTSTLPEVPKPDTTRKSPEKPARREVERERSPQIDDSEVNSTCETLTPPRAPSPERALTPPLPAPASRPRLDSDDELDLILDDIDGILSDDDDKDRPVEPPQPPKPTQPPADLRDKLPPRETKRPPRQKITFTNARGTDDKKRKEKSPVRGTAVSSSTKHTAARSESADRKTTEVKTAASAGVTVKSRPRIMFETKQTEKDKEKKSEVEEKSQPFPNRRVILHRNTPAEEKRTVLTRIVRTRENPAAGLFSRAVRTAISSTTTKVEYSDEEEEPPQEPGATVASVVNLPHGMTDTRLRTLAGGDVQSVQLNREERSARLSFRTPRAADVFRRKFHNKMVAASRLSVTLC